MRLQTGKEKGRREEVPAFSYKWPAGGGAGRYPGGRREEEPPAGYSQLPLAPQATLRSLNAFSKAVLIGLETSSAALVPAACNSLA